MKFKVGDRVKIREWDDMKREFGVDCLGDIRTTPSFVTIMKHLCGRVGTLTNVEGDHVHINFKDKSGNINWSYCMDMIEPVKPETIIIYHNRKDNTVVAKNTLTDEKAIAKCHPDDEFDFNIGAKVAFDRLMGVEPIKEEYYNGKVVCVERFNSFVTKGKVYQFENGLTIDDVGDPMPFTKNPIKDVGELNKRLSSSFIEVIE
jgi:hypothetical protein